MRYAHKIIGSRRCVAIKQNGRRCQRKAIWADWYHGDHELYHDIYNDECVTCVEVELCEDHARGFPGFKK